MLSRQSVVDASERHLRGELSASELRTIEDGAIRDVIRKQEQVGLPIVTDGEFRRRNFQDSFGNAVSGYDAPAVTGKDFRDPQAWRDPNNPGNRTEPNFEAAGPAIATRRAAVERLKLKKNVVLEEYKRRRGDDGPAGQGVADRAGSHRAALRLGAIAGRLQGHRRISSPMSWRSSAR